MQTLTKPQAEAFLCAMKCTRGMKCDGVLLQFDGIFVEWNAKTLDEVVVVNLTRDLADPRLTFTFEAFYDAFVAE